MSRDEISYVYLFFQNDKVAINKSNYLSGGYENLFPTVNFCFSWSSPKGTFNSVKECPGQSIIDLYNARPLRLIHLCGFNLQRRDRRGRISDDIDIDVIAGELPKDGSMNGMLDLKWVDAKEIEHIAIKKKAESDLAGLLVARRLLRTGWHIVVESVKGLPIDKSDTLMSCCSRVKVRWGGTTPLWCALFQLKWNLPLTADEYERQLEEYYQSLENGDASNKDPVLAMFGRDGKQFQDFSEEVETRLRKSFCETDESFDCPDAKWKFESDTLLGVLCDILTDFACSENAPDTSLEPDEDATLYDAECSVRWLRKTGLLDEEMSQDIKNALENPHLADDETLDDLISQVALMFSSRGEWAKQRSDEYLRQALKLRSESQTDRC